MARLLSLLAALAFAVALVIENTPHGLPLDKVLSLGHEKDVIVCTAVPIGHDTALTAAHCLNGPKALWLNRKYQAVPIKVDTDHDIALLKLTGVDTFRTWAKIAEPEFMDKLLVIGFPLADRLGHFVVETGTYMGPSNAEVQARLQWSLTTVPVYPGNSGGPMFKWDGGEWRLVGICNAISTIPFGWSAQLAPKLSWIQTHLKEFLTDTWSTQPKEAKTGSTD